MNVRDGKGGVICEAADDTQHEDEGYTRDSLLLLRSLALIFVSFLRFCVVFSSCFLVSSVSLVRFFVFFFVSTFLYIYFSYIVFLFFSF